MPDTTLPFASPGAEYRRVLGLFRALEHCRDDFERIEIVSDVCAAIRQLIAAERSVLFPLLEDADLTRGLTEEAHARQSTLLMLVTRLEALSPEEAGFASTLRQTYDLLRDYVSVNERELLPRLSLAGPPALHGAEQRWRDLQERMTEH